MRIEVSLRLVVIQVLFLGLLISSGVMPRFAVAENAGKTHLYFITNEGCAPCRQVEPEIEALKREGYPVTTVNYDANRQWASQLGVDRTPTVVMISNNQMVGRHAGLIDSTTLKKWFAAQGIRSGSAGVIPGANSRPVGTKSVLGQPKMANLGFDRSGQPDTAFSTPTMISGTARPANERERLAMQATVRLKVEDPEGTSYATGTVIHNHQGECLVVTCGHVFRDSKGTGRITADYGFDSGNLKSAPGQLIFYDSDARDIGLLAIRTTDRIVPVPIASQETAVESGRDIFSIGCDHGESPTIRHSKIKNRAKYDGAIKYDIYGRPVDGRSGGGLFTDAGELIGICNAAAVEVDEGIYTALDTIYWQLAKTNLDYLFKEQQIAALSPVPARPVPTDGASNQTFSSAPNLNRGFAESPRPVSSGPSLAAIPIRQPEPRSVAWADGGSADTEIIILIRSRTDPSNTESITISDPTPQLLDYLKEMHPGRLTPVDVARLRTQNPSQVR